MPFARPKRTHQPPPWQHAPKPAEEAPTDLGVSQDLPGPSWTGSALSVLGLALTAVVMFGDKPEMLARSAAYGSGLSIALTMFFDLQRGMRNLVRADILAIVGLYFLTLFEFLFPQEEFNALTNVEAARYAIYACLLGMGGLILGRHLRVGGHEKLATMLKRPLPKAWIVVVFVLCLGLGILHMLLAVDFNFWLMLEWCAAPRFTQPWSRGRLGDWKALLNELAMLLYLIPPIAGIAYARSKLFRFPELVVITLGFILVLYIGFASGTRNLFISYLVTFVIGYAFASPPSNRTRLIAVTSITVLIALVSTIFMLNFRTVGLKDWLQGRRLRGQVASSEMHVDMNLFVISQLVSTFPERQPYLGFEVPYLALIRPIPRAIWPDKPEGLSMSLEDASGADESWTVAASFIGEAYIAGGIIAVLLTGIFFGAACAWWTRLASPDNSEVGILIYASGFFAAAISMRSIFVFTTALLPTLSAIAIMWFMLKQLAKQAVRLVRTPGAHRVAPQRPPPRRPRPLPPRGQ